MGLPPLEGKVAFVSGASRGIGEALARRFAERGMRLALCARGEPVLSEGVDVLSRRIDVRDAEAVEAFTREIESRFGGVDLWVNNAGVLEPIRPLRDVRVHEFRDHLDTNLVGVFIGTRCYVRHLRRIGRGGVLVNMSSGAAWKPYAGWAAYCAGKAAVERLTEVVAAEEGSIGLRAYSVAPGVVDTAMQAQIRASDEASFPERERFVKRKRTGAFNDPLFVADELLALAFDPERRPDGVAVRLPFDGEPMTVSHPLR